MNENYKGLMTDIIAKQTAILGPDIALLKARNVQTIAVSDDGTVTEINGDPKNALGELVDEYVKLSGEIVRSTLTSVFAKYPELK